MLNLYKLDTNVTKRVWVVDEDGTEALVSMAELGFNAGAITKIASAEDIDLTDESPTTLAMVSGLTAADVIPLFAVFTLTAGTPDGDSESTLKWNSVNLITAPIGLSSLSAVGDANKQNFGASSLLQSTGDFVFEVTSADGDSGTLTVEVYGVVKQ